MSCPSVGFSPRLQERPFANSHKHLCLQTWSDNTLHKLVPFKHTLAFTIYALLARDSSFVFSLWLHKSPHPANQLGNLNWNVRGQRTAGSLISNTSSGDRKWTGKRERKWQFFHLHLVAGFDLNFSLVLTKANLWAVEATSNLEIMTCGAFYALNQTFTNTLNKKKNPQLWMSSLPGDLQADPDRAHIHHDTIL